jgi:hypothetical protein
LIIFKELQIILFLLIEGEIPMGNKEVTSEDDGGSMGSAGRLFGWPKGFGVGNDMKEKEKKRCNFCDTGTGIFFT